MKKIFLLATVLLASASMQPLLAQEKKKNKKNKAEVAQTVDKVELKTTSDSISYAAGMALTQGLDEYLKHQYKLTEEQIPEFIRGLKTGIAQRADKNFAAYAAGLQVAQQVEAGLLPNVEQQFDDKKTINPEMLYKGFLAVIEKDSSLFKTETAKTFYDQKLVEAKEAKNRANKLAGEQFLAANKQQPDVVTLPSGLQYKIITKGTGNIPKPTDKVRVVYEGRTLDGKVFDATERHGKPNDTFGVSNLIKGWTEALTMMPVGSKWEIYIPQELAYGERGAGKDIPPFSALIFTLELQGIEVPEVKPEKVVEIAPEKPAKPATKPNRPRAKKIRGK